VCAPHHSGIHVARIDPDLTACGDRLGVGPDERVVEHSVRIDDSTSKDTPATMIVVVAEQTGFGVKDQAWRGGKDIADICLFARPR